jgi:hypothetical protein
MCGDEQLLVAVRIRTVWILNWLGNQAFNQTEHEENVIAVQA